MSLLRRYEVFIKPRNSKKPLKMRDIKATSIGHLVTLQVRVVAMQLNIMQAHPPASLRGNRTL